MLQRNACRFLNRDFNNRDYDNDARFVVRELIEQGGRATLRLLRKPTIGEMTSAKFYKTLNILLSGRYIEWDEKIDLIRYVPDLTCDCHNCTKALEAEEANMDIVEQAFRWM